MKTETLDAELREIEAELGRQERVFEEFGARLASLGDVQIQLPEGFFEELSELAQKARIDIHLPAALGIRG